MAPNGRPPPHGRNHARNSTGNGRNDTADNSNTTAPNDRASSYVPDRPPPRPPAVSPPTAAERALFQSFQFPGESCDFHERDQSSVPVITQRPVSEQPNAYDTSARTGGTRPAPPPTGTNGVAGGEGQGQGQREQDAARQQSYPHGSYRPRLADMVIEDMQRLAEIRARANAIVNAAMALPASIDPERRGELATRQRVEEEEERRRRQDAQGAEDTQRRAEMRARAGAMVDAAIAGRTTIDSGSGRERARQREEEEERRRRQDVQVNGAGAGVEDEHAEDKDD